MRSKRAEHGLDGRPIGNRVAGGAFVDDAKDGLVGVDHPEPHNGHAVLRLERVSRERSESNRVELPPGIPLLHERAEGFIRHGTRIGFDALDSQHGAR